jgi:UDP-N-acetylmuramate--alanine ligase
LVLLIPRSLLLKQNYSNDRGVKGDLRVKTVDLSGKPFHFIGIGGIGMSALAYILAKRQLPVSGSDIRPSHLTARLESVGAQIFQRQEANNLEILAKPLKEAIFEAVALEVGQEGKYNSQSNGHGNKYYFKKGNFLPQIVCSTAISSNNSEYQAAVEKGYPIFHRSDLLAALIQDYHSIAVAGTHGKTTTSSLIGYLLLKVGLDPTIIVGGEVKAWEGNARLGESEFLVAEADESDGSLVKHCPKIGVITNIELDHPDHYESLEQVINTFQVFASQSETVVGCIDCPIVEHQIKPAITYSLNPDQKADYTLTNIIHTAEGYRAQVWEYGQFLGEMTLLLSGKHNLHNALAAVAVGRKLGLDFAVIAEAIATFEGAKRRFEYKGSYNGIPLIDDYAHHPSEIRCTLQAARLRANKYHAKRIVAIFQPHRYSRTAAFLEEFALCFADADVVILTDIYSAGEPNLGQVSGQQVADAVQRHHRQVYYHPCLSTLREFLADILQPGDLSLFLGAGNLNLVIPELLMSVEPLANVA